MNNRLKEMKIPNLDKFTFELKEAQAEIAALQGKSNIMFSNPKVVEQEKDDPIVYMMVILLNDKGKNPNKGKEKQSKK